MTQCTTLPHPDTRIAFSLHLFRLFQPSRWHPKWTCFWWWTSVHSWYYFQFLAELRCQLLSPIASPYSNCKAEVNFKRVKSLITSSTGTIGSLDTDALQRAILQNRNTPDTLNRISTCYVSIWSSKEPSYVSCGKMVPSHLAITTTFWRESWSHLESNWSSSS